MLLKSTVLSTIASLSYAFLWLRQHLIYSHPGLKHLWGEKMRMIEWIILGVLAINPVLMFGVQFIGDWYAMVYGVCVVQKVNQTTGILLGILCFSYSIIQVGLHSFLLIRKYIKTQVYDCRLPNACTCKVFPRNFPVHLTRIRYIAASASHINSFIIFRKIFNFAGCVPISCFLIERSSSESKFPSQCSLLLAEKSQLLLLVHHYCQHPKYKSSIAISRKFTYRGRSRNASTAIIEETLYVNVIFFRKKMKYEYAYFLI